MNQIHAEIIVVGAGLVGIAAAIAFAQQGKKVVLVVEKKPTIKLKKTWDARVYALTPATEHWLASIGVWAHVDASRVNSISAMHLFNDASERPLVLRDEDANLPKLGVIIENQNLMHALLTQLNALNVTLITDASCEKLQYGTDDVSLHLKDSTLITAKLIIAADGVNSWLRAAANIAVKQKDYNQTAIVANFKAQKNHQQIARQWFAPHDILALLPMPDGVVSMVWSVSTEKADELLLLSDDELAQKVLAQSKSVLGDLSLVGATQHFALKQQTAFNLVGKRIVLMGDAAHQIHPMAGQGVNLGFRDVMDMLAVTTKISAMHDIGDENVLRQYARTRAADVATMNTLTTGLNDLFAQENGLLKKLSRWGFKLLNHRPSLKKLLIQLAAA